MKKRIFVITVIIILTLQSVCGAAGLSKCLNGSAVNVIEDEDSIDIYALVSFAGDEKDDFVPNTAVTYSEAFIIGVRYVWSGVYNENPVKVHIEEVKNTSALNHVTVIFGSVTGKESYSRARKASATIWMYTGDGRSGIDDIYDYNSFLYVSGHEFGHILGLSDAYKDLNKQVRENLKSVMNSWNCRHATEADYYAILKHRTWLGNIWFTYSSDRALMERYLSK